MEDLRSYIEKKGYREIRKSVDVEFEIAGILEKRKDTILFSNIKGYEKFRVIGNLFNSREELCAAIGTSKEEYLSHVSKALENPIEPRIVSKGECQEKTSSLYELPVLKHFEKDAGRYITGGIVIARDSEYGRNMSIHRLLLHSDNMLGIRIVPRHLYEYFKRAERKGKDLDVAIVIGVHPAILFAASYSTSIDFDELSLAGALLGKAVEVVRCKSVDIEVPRNAEIVIEGRIIANERRKEGPFCDVTKTYDVVREEPVIEVKKVYHRKNAIYHALLPSSIEHRLLMGMPREVEIYRKMRKVANVKNVVLSNGGFNWLHGVISIERDGKTNIRKIIEHAFEAHRSMKHVVIVDSDVDVFNINEVEKAIATRFQAHRDLYIYKEQHGSSLDPSSDKQGLTTKLGIDATKKGDKSKYDQARIP